MALSLDIILSHVIWDSPVDRIDVYRALDGVLFLLSRALALVRRLLLLCRVHRLLYALEHHFNLSLLFFFFIYFLFQLEVQRYPPRVLLVDTWRHHIDGVVEVVADVLFGIFSFDSWHRVQLDLILVLQFPLVLVRCSQRGLLVLLCGLIQV